MKAKSELTLVDGITKRSPEPAQVIAQALGSVQTAWLAVNLLDGGGKVVPTFVRPSAVIAVGAIELRS